MAIRHPSPYQTWYQVFHLNHKTLLSYIWWGQRDSWINPFTFLYCHTTPTSAIKQYKPDLVADYEGISNYWLQLFLWDFPFKVHSSFLVRDPCRNPRVSRFTGSAISFRGLGMRGAGAWFSGWPRPGGGYGIISDKLALSWKGLSGRALIDRVIKDAMNGVYCQVGRSISNYL